MNKSVLKKALRQKTGCTIQHNGWPCGTCFFESLELVNNRDWQTLLLYRGDYEEKDLDNLPPKESRKEVLQNILNLCKQ